MNKITINTTKLFKYDMCIRMRIIRKALRYLNVPHDKRYVEYILTLLEENKTGKKIDLPGVIVRRNYDKLLIERKGGEFKPKGKESIDTHLSKILLPGKKIHLQDSFLETEIIPTKSINMSEYKTYSKYTVYFDYDNLSLPLKMRYRTTGDVFTPFGFRGKKKLKKVLIEDKVPVYRRDLIPLVVDSEDNILWIAGVRRSNKAPITKETQSVLNIKLIKRTT